MRHIFFYLNAFLGDIAVGLNMICIPLLAIKMQASPVVLGFTGFLSSLTYLTFSPIFGRLADRKNPLYLTSLGCALFASSALFLVFFPSIPLILLIMGLVGLGTSMFWSPLEVWIARTTSDLRKSIGYFNLSWCVGLSIGSLLGGYLFQKDWRFPLFSIAFSCLLIIFFLFFCPKVSPPQEVKEVNDEPNSGESKRNPFILIGWTANFVGWFTIGTLRYLFPKLAVELNISPFTIGLLTFTMAIFQAISSYGVGFMVMFHYNLGFLLIVQFLMMLGFLIIILSSSIPLFFLSFTLLGICIGIAYFFSLFYSLESEEGKGHKSGIHESIVGAGGLLGPLLGGIVAQYSNLRMPFTLCIFILSVGMLLEVIWYNMGKGGLRNNG
ncbi:MFS transporter [bacterium]|nr:MFS transporter [bacterium]